MGISAAPGDDERGDRRPLPGAHHSSRGPSRVPLDPIAIDRAEGVYLYTPEGKRILDFNSQLMSVNIGHGDRRVDRRDHRAGDRSSSTSSRRSRPRSAPGWARSWPRSCPATWTRCSSPSAAPRRSRTRSSSRATTPAATRSSPATARTTAPRSGAMTLTGDSRRWANEPGLVGVVRYPDTHRWGEKEPRPVDESLQGLEDVIRYEGAAHDRGGLPRDDRGHQRHPHPARRLPPGRPRAVRPVRDPDGRRRGHGGLRPDRAAGSRSTTGTWCRT